MSVFVLNPSGRTTNRRANHGTSPGVRRSWTTRRARYGDTGDSPAARALHALGITNLGLKRGLGGASAKTRAKRQRGLPAYWKKSLSGGAAGARKKKARTSRRAPSAPPRRATARRPNAFFANTERHSKHAHVKWARDKWPAITLYTLIKRHGVLGGQREYERYLREHGISLSRRRGGGSKRGKPAHRGKESGMARRKKARRNPRGRRKSALALLAPKRKRRRKAARKNPAPKRRKARKTRKVASKRRRRNPPILWSVNPTRKRRKKARKSVSKRRSTRRKNPPILWSVNPGKRRKLHRRGKRRHNPDFSLGGIKSALMGAIPTLEDAKTVGIMTGFGLLQELVAWRPFDKLKFPIWDYVPYGDHMVFTLVGTALASILGGPKWAKPVMYGGLQTIASGYLKSRAAGGTFGTQVANLTSQWKKGFADYVSMPASRGVGPIGDRQMSDYVTMSGGEDDVAGAIEGGRGGSMSFGVPEQESMADYYGVTAV